MVLELKVLEPQSSLPRGQLAPVAPPAGLSLMKTFVVFKNSVGTRREIRSSRCQSLFRLVFGGTDSFFLNHFELKRPRSQHWL